MTYRKQYRNQLLLIVVSLLAACVFSKSIHADDLEAGFASPPDSTRPYVYWYWMNNNISKEGVSKDLEMFSRAGIGSTMIGHIWNIGSMPEGDVPILSEAWWDILAHAVREAERFGVKISMFNGPGWSQSGGPWNKPEQSMRYLVSRETVLKPGESFDGALPGHEKAIQDVAVIAYPTPRFDREMPELLSVETSPKNEPYEKKLLESPENAQIHVQSGLTVEYTFEKQALVQSFVFSFAGHLAVASGEILARIDGNDYERIGGFSFNNHGNMEDAMGPRRHDAYTFSLKPTKTDKVKIVFHHANVIAEKMQITSMALIDRGVEKQLGRMWGTPIPPSDAYLWPQQPENTPGSSVSMDRVVNLTKQLAPDGRLRWTPPESTLGWTIERIGMAPTGSQNKPAPPQATGLEVDKMSRKHIASHFDGMIGEFMRRVPEEQRKAFERITIDSYEVGPQNWTDDFAEVFTQRYGYDPIPWLPCVNGRIVENREQTDRFLWDWRRLVADLIAERYVGGLREVGNRHGVKLWLENYGHWGFPAESLQYGAYPDEIGGEYWLNSYLGPVECRLASSSAHVYGKTRISSEAFTSATNFLHFPSDLKTRGDWSLTTGINHLVLHLTVQQPYNTPPGVVPAFGTDFNRNSTWFPEFGCGWVDYLKRCCFLLQQGTHVGDVAYFFGEDAPRMNGDIDPPLPAGYDYDFINADPILSRMSCRDGRWTLQDGKQYRVLAIPAQVKKMRPELIEKIVELVKEGCVLLGSPPDGSPSLRDYPNGDKIVLDRAAELWGTGKEKMRRVGKGLVFRDVPLEYVFQELKLTPDIDCKNQSVLWTHRYDAEASADIYFLSNQSSASVALEPTFRVVGKQPEFWDAVSGTRSEAAVYQMTSAGTSVRLNLEPNGSIFVVFRKPFDNLPAVVSVEKDGENIFNQSGDASDFTLFLQVEPSVEIQVPNQPSGGGVFNNGQNWLYFPEQGTHTWGAGNSGSGISIGSNGIMISEHWSFNLPPVLVWKSEKPLDKCVIAWVLRNGQSLLYVDGKKVAEGTLTGQAVHAPCTISPSFSGGLYRKEFLKTALTPEAIAEMSARWIKENKNQASELPLLEPILLKKDGRYVLKNAAPGRYKLTLENGRSKSCTISPNTAPFDVKLDENWDVEFRQRGGETRNKRLERLIDWRNSEDEFIKYFSGTARYRKTFTMPDYQEKHRVVLFLGNVSNICSVSIDGKKKTVLWQPPFYLDITNEVQPDKEHVLEIEVANSWLNRMIGDEQYPDDLADDPDWKAGRWPKWFVSGAERPEPRRISFSSLRQVHRESPLVPSGLIGPVRIVFLSDEIVE